MPFTVRAAVLACALPAVACTGTPIVRNGPPQQRVIARAYDVPVDEARTKILEAFTSRRMSLPPPFQRLGVIELKPPSYPAGWLEGFRDSGGFLADYKRLPPSDRANDLLLREATGDYYWLSDYVVAGTDATPVKFHCGLILHFVARTSSGAPGAEIQVYEQVPTVWVGEHWAFSREGPGFGRYHDIRFVEPTVSDRVRTLDLLDGLLRSAR